MPYASLKLTIPTAGSLASAQIRLALADLISYKDLTISLGGYIVSEPDTFKIFQALY